MLEADNAVPEKRVLQETDHPEFGRCVTFVDGDGLGMQIGEGRESFIVRPLARGLVRVEAPTEEAAEKARLLYGRVVDQRGGHR